MCVIWHKQRIFHTLYFVCFCLLGPVSHILLSLLSSVGCPLQGDILACTSIHPLHNIHFIDMSLILQLTSVKWPTSWTNSMEISLILRQSLNLPVCIYIIFLLWHNLTFSLSLLYPVQIDQSKIFSCAHTHTTHSISIPEASFGSTQLTPLPISPPCNDQ
jgi:hypothetical protein